MAFYRARVSKILKKTELSLYLDDASTDVTDRLGVDIEVFLFLFLFFSRGILLAMLHGGEKALFS